MYHRIFYYGMGWASIVIGLLATLCIFRIHNMFYGIALSIAGFIVSGINIYLNMKYYGEEQKYPKGYLGMLFSSLPVLFLLFVIFRFRH